MPLKPPAEEYTIGDEFHRVIGYCVAEWSWIDEQLFRIFQVCVGKPEQCAIIFYSLPGLNQRLKLTSEIVLSLLPKPKRKSGGHDERSVQYWKDIEKRVSGLLAMRRRIAHHQVTRTTIVTNSKAPPKADAVVINTPEKETILASWFEIYMSEGEALRGRGVEKVRIAMVDLRKHLQELRLVVSELEKFHTLYIRTLPEAHLPLDGSWIVP
jgi:hypothetical protein